MQARSFFRSPLSFLSAAILLLVALVYCLRLSDPGRPSPNLEKAQASADATGRGKASKVDSGANRQASPAQPADDPPRVYSDDELLPVAEDISDVDLDSVPAGSIVFEHHSLDELREAEGLPAIDAALLARNRFPIESQAEAADPDLHELYELDREIHRANYLAQHKIIERNRYWTRAQSAPDDETRKLMLSSAKYHARIAISQQRRHDKLVRKRKARVSEMRDRRLAGR